MLTLKIQDKSGLTRFVEHGESEVSLVATSAYVSGDYLVLEVDRPTYLWLQWDEGLGRSLVYATENVYFDVPFDEKKICYPPNSFMGDRHLLYAKVASDFEISAYRNLALNVNDSHRDCKCYPHATANVETRGESVFAARNAIDGVTANSSHGEWPYSSWGINQDPKAELKLDFGRDVTVDKIVIYERADFPHDNWWKEVTINFSDGSTIVAPMVKTAEGQAICFEEKTITSLTLCNLIKSDDPSPFPALSQIEVYGRG